MTKPVFQNRLLDVLTGHLSDQAICMLDKQGKIITWNAGASHFYGLPENAALGRHASLLFHHVSFDLAIQNAFGQGRYECEWPLKNQTDSHGVFISMQSVYDEDVLQGFSLYARSLFYDKKAGSHLLDNPQTRNSSGLFQQLIEHSYSGITLFDEGLNFIYRNSSAARITGFTDPERTSTSINEMIHPADQSRVKALLQSVLQAPGTSETCLFRSRHFDGHFIYLECVLTNWLEEPGINAVVLNFRDVSEQQQAELGLAGAMKELSAYKYALDEAAIVAITDQRGRITHVNDYFCRISGYSRDELLGQDHRLINSDYHPPEYIRNLWQTIATGHIWRGEFRNRAKNGDHYWVATTIVPFLNGQRKPYQYMAIRFDITAAKQLKRELQRVFDNVPDIICVTGTDRKYKRVNNAMCSILNYTEAELLQLTIDKLIHPDDLAESKQRMQKFRNDELDTLYFENRYLSKHGAVVHLAWTVQKAAEKGILFCVAKDITEKKKLEELLQKSNELARIGSWALNPATGTVYWSPVAQELLGLKSTHSMTWTEVPFCGPEPLEKITSAIAEVIDRYRTFDIEIEVNVAKGDRRWVRILGEGEFQDGICSQVYGSVQDIDDRKRADLKLIAQAEELAASGRRYSELFHMSPLPMFVFDLQTLCYLDVNDAAIQQYGYTRDEFLRMTIRDIRPRSEMGKLEAVVRDQRRSDYQFRPGLFTHVRKNGDEIKVEIVSSALQYRERPARLALAMDVTERARHLAEIEGQNQKLRDISWMQSHVIRAPLSRIMGLVSLLQDTDPDANAIAEIISYIQISANELDQVIHDITANAARPVSGC